MEKMLKGFVFTLDAVFALVIAITAISVLLYVHYFSNTGFYRAPLAEATSIMQNLLQTTVAMASNSSSAVLYIARAGMATFSWPQFAHDQGLSSTTGYGLQTPYLLFTFTANNFITPMVVVDQNVAAFGSGNYLYAINATNGNVVLNFPVNSGQANVVMSPAIYKNEIIFANSLGYINAVSLYNGLANIWSTNIGAGASTPLEIENNYLVFNQGGKMYVINPVNGTIIASNVPVTGSNIITPAYYNGEFFIPVLPPSTYHILTYSLTANNMLNQDWQLLLAGAPNIFAAAANNTAIVGESFLYVLYPSSACKGFCILTPTGTFAKGVAISGANTYIMQTDSGINVFNSIHLYQYYPTSAFGSTSGNATPSATPDTVYTLAGSGNNYFAAFSTQTKQQLWNIQLPTSTPTYTSYINVPIAYGNAYVPNGNKIYVFGTYKAQSGDSLLQELSNMYLNNQSTLSNLILSNIYKSIGVGILINNSYAPNYAGVASFNGLSSYVVPSNSLNQFSNSVQPLSISVWIKPNTGNGIVVEELGQTALNSGYHYSIIELVNGNLNIRVPPFICSQTVAIPSNTWTNIALTFNGNLWTPYVNGAALSTTFSLSHAAPANDYYAVGANDLTNNCGSGKTFNGLISDFLIYNTSLSPGQVLQNYQTGIYGIPLASGLNLWYPLNGNANDYGRYYNFGLSYQLAYQNANYTPAQLRNAYQISKSSVPLNLNVSGKTRVANVSVITWR